MIQHRNNIGLMRLIFASLVIVGHAPEIVDGDRLREPLTMIFHTLSLGELSVDAFFLLSGYLITMSMARSRSLKVYLERRVLRIYPAYLVAFSLCVFVAGPLVGIHPLRQLPATLGDMLFLREPRDYPGSLTGLAYRTINGSMWTIALEFRCYLIIALFGAFGLLLQKRWVTGFSLVLLAGMVLATFGFLQRPLLQSGQNPWVLLLVGHDPGRALGLLAVFMAGSVAYLWREALAGWSTANRALVSILLATLCLFSRHLAEVGMTVFGGFSLFWLSLKANLGRLQAINDRWDISYGTYLYGWPITTMILYSNRSISPVVVAMTALPLALLVGTASWFLVERWTKDLLKSKPQSPERGVGGCATDS